MTMGKTAFRRWARGASLLGALYLSLIATGACGGSSPEAKSPSSSADGGAATTAPASDGGAAPAPMTAAAGIPVGDELSGAAKDAYMNGWAAWSSGDLPAAKAAFQDAASKAQKPGAPQYSLGCVLERLGDKLAALDAYRAAFTADPAKYVDAIGAYAVLQANLGHGSEAEQFLNDKLSQKPDDLALMTYLAEVKSIAGDSAGCQKLAQQVLSKSPTNSDAMVAIARDYYRGHKWDLAQYALKAILDGDPPPNAIPPRDKGNPQALLMRALIERDLGSREAAMKDFAQAVAGRSDMFEAYINLGEMKLEAGNATEAQGPLEKAVHFAPNQPTAHLDLGDCYRLLGRPTDAKTELDKASTLDSTLAGVHYNMGLLYLFSKKGDVPGVASDDDRLAKAIHELDTFKSMRGIKAAKGVGDDVEELLSTAKKKQTELQMAASAAAAAASASAAPSASAPAPGSSAAPAPSGSASTAAAKPAQ
jgi:tetratricopeptide (TPR) repeat protein